MFAESVCWLPARATSASAVNPAFGQLLRCATAPAAIYAEARAAETKRDFVHKTQLCLKELRETQVWLELLRRLGDPSPASHLLAEANELSAIFVSSIKTARL